jgi:hypothetical protein
VALDKTKIFGAAADLYIAIRESADTPVSHVSFPGDDWYHCGYIKAKTAKLDSENHEIDLHTGEKHQLGVTLKFEAEGLQCDVGNIQFLENCLNSRCDVILKARGSSRHWKLLGMNISHGFKGVFAADDVLSIPIKGQVMGPKVGDCFDEITIT